MASEYNNKDDTFEQNLLYDARQRRVKLICDCIDAVIISAKNENFYNFLKNIDDLYSVSNHIFLKQEFAKENYFKIRSEILKIAEENILAWRSNRTDTEDGAKIEMKLRELFQFIMDELQIANFFGGSSDDDDGL